MKSRLWSWGEEEESRRDTKNEGQALAHFNFASVQFLSALDPNQPEEL